LASNNVKELRRKKNMKNFRRNLNPYLFIIPSFIFLGLVMIYPIVMIVIFSLSKWSMLEYTVVDGSLDNYIRIFKDPIFWTIIKNNLTVLINVPIQILVSVIIASLLFDNVRGSRFYQFSYFVPTMLPVVVVGIIWIFILRIDGPLNNLLRLIGLGSLAKLWLGNVTWSLPSVIGVMVWKDVGFVIILFLSTLLGAPVETFDAAKLDGANRWQILLHIKLPIMYPIMYIYGVLGIIWSFTDVFSYVYVLTSGGPGYSSTVIEYLIYISTFKNLDFGYGSALSVFVSLIVTVFVIVYIKLIRRGDEG